MMSSARFVGDFDVHPIDGRVWYLQNPYRNWGAIVTIGKKRYDIFPEDGFITDFASIPRFGWCIVGPPTGHGKGKDYGRQAVIHDYLYSFASLNGEPITQAFADKVFYLCLRAGDVDRWRCKVMYKIVQAFGGKYFGKPEKLDQLRGQR